MTTQCNARSLWLPVVDDKHHQLGEGAEKVDQIRNAIILVINTRKVDHIKIFNSFDAIEKRYCSTLLFSCTCLNCLQKE